MEGTARPNGSRLLIGTSQLPVTSFVHIPLPSEPLASSPSSASSPRPPFPRCYFTAFADFPPSFSRFSPLPDRMNPDLKHRSGNVNGTYSVSNWKPIGHSSYKLRSDRRALLAIETVYIANDRVLHCCFGVSSEVRGVAFGYFIR